MSFLNIPRDAFSHGQVKSKLWLSENFAIWAKKYLNSEHPYTLHWFGSWVGIGPFLLLSQQSRIFSKVNLYDLNLTDLNISANILDYWKCESVEINIHNADVNEVSIENDALQIVINTSCEHILGNQWLDAINKGSFVILQSTNMPHQEHINCPTDILDFINKYKSKLNIIDSLELAFSYPDKKFSRYMLLGQKI